MEKVRLSEIFGNNIFTRRTISDFFKKLKEKKSKSIEIDFSDVEFISRSCTDEYIKQKKKATKKIIEVNMSKNICDMFNAVKNQYEKAGIAISFDICNIQNKNLVPA